MLTLLSAALRRRVQHILNKNPMPRSRIVHQYMGTPMIPTRDLLFGKFGIKVDFDIPILPFSVLNLL